MRDGQWVDVTLAYVEPNYNIKHNCFFGVGWGGGGVEAHWQPYVIIAMGGGDSVSLLSLGNSCLVHVDNCVA